ncbi:MAG TPA: DUF2891 domain-containing protein [Kofleriaceae bacterium]
MTLQPDAASRFARLALACVHREYPNALSHVLDGDGDVAPPSRLHPAFYGCLDWHSAVHGHWLLARVLRASPALPEAAAIRAALDRSLTAANLAAELAYFRAPNRGAFERTYGWAWLLELARALHGWDDHDAARWRAALAPLAGELAHRYRAFLPKQRYPIRTGVHANTAFGMALALDYARDAGDAPLEAALVARALAYYAGDRDAPIGWEPSGEDFLSPALVEADLMRRVLPAARFAPWLHAFLVEPAFAPVEVGDRSDPKLAHLDGLNLSRAWCLRAIAGALSPADPLRARLAEAADAHAGAGLAHVATGDYMGEHWLATFAVYLSLVPAPR